MMKSIATTLLVIGTLIAPSRPSPAVTRTSIAPNRRHSSRIRPSPTKIPTKLAAEHITLIHVDTDANGVVWLHGTARTQKVANEAVEIARATEGVKDVHSRITVRKDSY